MTDWINRCHFGDVREVLRRMIADGVKVNTIVTSPPYWGLRDYGHPGQIGLEPTIHEFIATMVDVFDLARQVLADDGTAWVNMGDSYATKSDEIGLKPKDLAGQPWRLAFALQDAGWWLRQDIIWSKPNPMPESVRDRCTKAHEYIFLLSKSDRYYYDFDAVQEEVNGGAHPRRAGPNAMRGQGSNRPEGSGRANREGRDMREVGVSGGRKLAAAGSGTKNNDSMDEALSEMRSLRNRRSVWTVASQPYKGAHFATFPTKLVEPCILAGSPVGGTVLDIFFGSGTTGEVAQRLGRNFIGIEINPDYKPLQDERLRQPSLNLEAA